MIICIYNITNNRHSYGFYKSTITEYTLLINSSLYQTLKKMSILSLCLYQRCRVVMGISWLLYLNPVYIQIPQVLYGYVLILSFMNTGCFVSFVIMLTVTTVIYIYIFHIRKCKLLLQVLDGKDHAFHVKIMEHNEKKLW